MLTAPAEKVASVIKLNPQGRRGKRGPALRILDPGADASLRGLSRLTGGRERPPGAADFWLEDVVFRPVRAEVIATLFWATPVPMRSASLVGGLSSCSWAWPNASLKVLGDKPAPITEPHWLRRPLRLRTLPYRTKKLSQNGISCEREDARAVWLRCHYFRFQEWRQSPPVKGPSLGRRGGSWRR